MPFSASLAHMYVNHSLTYNTKRRTIYLCPRRIFQQMMKFMQTANTSVMARMFRNGGDHIWSNGHNYHHAHMGKSQNQHINSIGASLFSSNVFIQYNNTAVASILFFAYAV